MAKRRKSSHVKTYHECMSGQTGEIHNQRELLKAKMCKEQGKRVCNIKLDRHQAGQALSKAAGVCKR